VKGEIVVVGAGVVVGSATQVLMALRCWPSPQETAVVLGAPVVAGASVMGGASARALVAAWSPPACRSLAADLQAHNINVTAATVAAR